MFLIYEARMAASSEFLTMLKMKDQNLALSQVNFVISLELK